MINKNVCPKCGQLYDQNMEKCPLCGAPAPKPDYEPVRRQRFTEEERRRHRAEKRQSEQLDRKQAQAEKKRLRAEEEAYLEAEEARERAERRQRRKGESSSPVPAAEETERAGDSVPTGYVAASILVLVLALLIGGSFLLWSHGVMANPVYDKLSGQTVAAAQPETTLPSTEERLFCTAVIPAEGEIVLSDAETTRTLVYEIQPEGCVDQVTFETENDRIAAVSADGIVSLAGPGKTTLTIRCGEQTAEVSVSCVVPLLLNKENVAFYVEGDSFALEVENAYPGAELTFTSDDPTVATVDENGVVTAVGAGEATIIAAIGDATGELAVQCNFR